MINLSNIPLVLTLLTLFCNLVESQVAYTCQVNNCKSCFYFNLCGLCEKNYILNISQENSLPYCAPVSCPDENCDYCL